MRSLKNNILRIKKNKKKVCFLRRRKIKSLREINLKITTFELSINLLLLKLNVEIINKKNIIRVRLIVQIMLRAMRYATEPLIKKKTKSNADRCNIEYVIYQITISLFIIKKRNHHIK